MDIFLLDGTRLEGAPAGATNRLYKSNRDGGFSDVTVKAGLHSAGWACEVCVGDHNKDGFQELFCTYHGQNKLYRNDSDDTFTDVSEASGIGKHKGSYDTTAVTGNFDGDGWPDIFLACDSTPSLLLLNHHDGTFRGAGDIALNASTSLLVTHFQQQASGLYLNDGKGNFTDATLSRDWRWKPLRRLGCDRCGLR